MEDWGALGSGAPRLTPGISHPDKTMASRNFPPITSRKSCSAANNILRQGSVLFFMSYTQSLLYSTYWKQLNILQVKNVSMIIFWPSYLLAAHLRSSLIRISILYLYMRISILYLYTCISAYVSLSCISTFVFPHLYLYPVSVHIFLYHVPLSCISASLLCTFSSVSLPLYICISTSVSL